MTRKSATPVPADLAAYCLLCAGYLALVWLLPYFPSQDGPSHLYNLVILQDLLHGGKNFGHFFTYEIHAIPNLGFYLVAYPLLTFFPALVVEKIFVSIYLLLLVTSVPFLLKTFRKPPLPVSFLLFPVLLNFNLLMGFYSYCISVPLFILAFGLAWRTRNSSLFCRLFCLNAAGIILYYTHAIAFELFILSLGAIVIGDSLGNRERIIKAMKLFMLISPLLLNFFVYLGGHREIGEVLYHNSFEELVGLLSDLLCFSTVYFSLWQILPGCLLTLLVLFSAKASAKEIRDKRMAGEALASSEKTLIFLTLFLVALYLFAPFAFGEGSFFNQRFPWVILIIVLPLLTIPTTILSRPVGTAALASLALLFLVINTGVLFHESGKVEKYLTGLQSGLPHRSAIMGYMPGVPTRRVDALLHATSYYGMFNRCVDLGNYETTVHFFPVRVKGKIPAVPQVEQMQHSPMTIRWDKFPHVQYLVCWDVDSEERKSLAGHYDVFWSNDEVSLWRRKGSLASYDPGDAPLPVITSRRQ